jgi:hypothetical protein
MVATLTVVPIVEVAVDETVATVTAVTTVEMTTSDVMSTVMMTVVIAVPMTIAMMATVTVMIVARAGFAVIMPRPPMLIPFARYARYKLVH